METNEIIILAAAVLAVLVIAGALFYLMSRRRHHTSDLRETFGTEYDRLAGATDRKEAERELDERKERVEAYELVPLTANQQRQFAERWRVIQAEFVDRPGVAIGAADDLLVEMMKARGYQVDADAEHRAADVSVGHGDEAEDYRAAREIASRNRNGSATTEDLRQAMLHFRSVFDAVLEPVSSR